MRKCKLTISSFALFLISTIISAQDITADLSYFPKKEFNDKIVESITANDGNTFEKIVIDGFDTKIPFYLIKPLNGKKNNFVFLLHGATSSKDSWIYPMSSYSKNYIKLKDSLLSLGYSVIIPDAKYHGERSYESNFESPVTFISTQETQKVYNLFSTTVKDIRIIMDYVQSNLESDTATFDVIGYSMGGMIAVLLNSIDDRLNRVVACVVPLDLQKTSEMMGMHKENAKKLGIVSPKNYAQLQMAPITLLMGTKDGWYTKEEVQIFFDKITIKDKSLKFYEAGHSLPVEFISDAIQGILRE